MKEQQIVSTMVEDVVEEPVADAPGRSRLRTLPRPGSVALAVVVLLDLLIPVVFAYRMSLITPTFHMDGAFQTASGLIRMSDGEVPGRDFFPYLGIGPLLLLYPAFALHGADVAGSVFSSFLVALMAVQLVFALSAALVLGRRSRWAIALAAAVPLLLFAAIPLSPAIAGSIDVACGGCVMLFHEASIPGNSLRPVRALAPYLLAAVACFTLTRRGRLLPKLAVIGTASGVVAALWSNDYGLISGGLMVATVTVVALRSGAGRRVRATAVLWGSAGAALLVAGFGATAGNYLSYLRYNFVDVRGDQFWYFGGWAVDEKVYSVGDLLRIMWTESAILPVVVLAGVVAWTAWRRQLRWVFATYVGTALLLGGLAGTIGGHMGSYFWAFRIWSYVVLLWALVAVVGLAGSRAADRLTERNRPLLARRLSLAVPAATVVALLVAGALTVDDARDERNALAADPGYRWNPALGGYLDTEFTEHVELTAEPGARVLEEYMGLAGSVSGPRRDLDVDAVIHALGDRRAEFADRAAEPHDMVVTSVPEMDQFVSWSISANWWFYRNLFQSYRPTQTSPRTIVWTPAEPEPWAPVDCRITDSGVQLETPERGFYEVDLRYRGPGRDARAFTMLQNNINVAIEADGYVALDPGAASQQVPVFVRQTPESGTTTLAVKDIRGGDHDEPLTEFLGCTARAVTVPDGADTVYLYSGLALTDTMYRYQRTPARLDNETWTHGVHDSDDAAFVLPASPRNSKALETATEVEFSDGETRRIESHVQIGYHIYVDVEGPRLDPETAGFPNMFTLRD